MYTKLAKRIVILMFIALAITGCRTNQAPAVIVVTATGGVDAGAPALESNDPASAVVSQELNVRTGPSSTYDVAGILPGGTTVEVVGKTADSSWLQIVYPAGPGGLGWISAAFAQASDLSSVPVVSAPVASSGGSSGGSSGDSSGGSNGDSSGGSSGDSSGGSNGGSSPTDPPPPTSSPPTSEPSGGGQTAPNDSDYSLVLEFKNSLKAKCCPTLQDVISYPGGDSSDKISFELKGFDSITNTANTRIIITCAGEGAEYVKIKFSKNNNTVGCNSTFNTNWTSYAYKGSFEIYVDSGSDVYVTWIAIFDSSK